MKILTISNYFPEHSGGIEFVALNLVSRWREHNTVHWMACDVPSHPHKCNPGDIPFSALTFTEEKMGFPYPIPLPRDILRIFEQVRWSNIVHIHDCLYLANFYAFLAAGWYHKPLVITQHVGLVPYTQTYKNLLQRIAYGTLGRLVLKRSDTVIFISERVKDWFQKRLHFKRPVKFIPNGIDHTMFYRESEGNRHMNRDRLGYSEKQNIALFVGRFTEKKGLNLIRQIAHSRPNLFWLIIGRGDLDPNTWSLPNVKVLSTQSQSELRVFYNAADIFILPSVGEGFPLAVQEALTCGLPVLVSQETASILPDAPLIAVDISDASSVLRVLDDMLTNKNFLQLTSSSLLKYSRRWDWDSVATEYEEIFEQILTEDIH